MAIANIVEALGGKDRIRIVELGKIKIGGLGKESTSQGGSKYRQPVKHDYFTITTMNRTPTPAGAPKGDLMPDRQLMDQLVNQYADPDGKLRQIPVRFLSDDIDDVLQVAFVWYHGARCCARSDGVEVTWFNDPTNGRAFKEPLVEPWSKSMLEFKNSKNQNLFKLHSVLNVVVAAKEARWGGIYKFRTTSRISFEQLYSTLVHIQQLTGGILRGMPAMLRVRGKQVAPDGKPTTVHVVHAELVGSEIQQIQQMAIDQAKWRIENKMTMDATQKQFRKLLCGPGQESPDEVKDIQDEFVPEMGDIEPEPEGNYSLLDDDDAINDAHDDAQDADISGTGDASGAAADVTKPNPPVDNAAAADAPVKRTRRTKAEPKPANPDAVDTAKVDDTTGTAGDGSPPSDPPAPAADPTATYPAFVDAVMAVTKDKVDPAVVAFSFDKMPVNGLVVKDARAGVGGAARQKVLDAITAGKFDFVTGKITA